MSQDNPIRPIGADEPFHFSCNPKVPCFNACCRDLTQNLSPFDVVRLKTHFQMRASDFLQKYTRWYEGPQSGLPVVVLIPADGYGRCCPFLSDKGCRVYEDRPGSCRMYPLGRMLSRSREDGQIRESFFLITEPHCRGFEQGAVTTPREWMADQGLTSYNAFDDIMIEVIAARQRCQKGGLDKELVRNLHTILYDVDAFRQIMIDDPEARGHGGDCRSAMEDAEILRRAMAYARRLLTE